MNNTYIWNWLFLFANLINLDNLNFDDRVKFNIKNITNKKLFNFVFKNELLNKTNKYLNNIF